MRTVMIALLAATVALGVLVTTNHFGRMERSMESLQTSVAVPGASEADTIMVIDDAPTTGPALEGITHVYVAMETPESTRTPSLNSVPANSMIRDVLVGYLVEGGLSTFDSERIVGLAIDGLAECDNAFRESDVDRMACDRNVIQEAGMYEAFRRLSRDVLNRYARESVQGP